MTETWADLFDRAAAADATLEDVRERFAALRAGADPTEPDGTTEPGEPDGSAEGADDV